VIEIKGFKTKKEMNTMKKMIVITLIVAFLSGGMLSGCGSKGSSTTIQATDKTLGQELVDLQTAHEKGIISDKEYENTKKRMMDKYK
jgi:hypothetical protein